VGYTIAAVVVVVQSKSLIVF